MKKTNHFVKRKLFTLFLAFCGMLIYSQAGKVGINTSTPATTLDVTGLKDASGNFIATHAAGLQAPRMTRAELSAKGDAVYGASQAGALAYITDVSGGNANLPQRGMVTAIGYYYFDGTKWVGLASDQNIVDHLNALNIPQVISILSFMPKQAVDTEATTYLGPDLGSSFRVIQWSNELLDKTNSYDPVNYEFTAPKSGYYNFVMNLAFHNPTSVGSYMRIGISTPYTGTFALAGNASFGIIKQEISQFNIASIPEFINANGMLFLTAGQKVKFLTRYLDPTIYDINIESINYNRVNNNKLIITYFGQ